MMENNFLMFISRDKERETQWKMIVMTQQKSQKDEKNNAHGKWKNFDGRRRRNKKAFCMKIVSEIYIK